jgi:acetoin utilization deacetylase AcuC-like enzyme
MTQSNIIQVITSEKNDKALPFLLDNQTNEKSDCHETPSRIDKILDGVKPMAAINIQYQGIVRDAELHNNLAKVHSNDYISFLKKTSDSLEKDKFLLEHAFVPKDVEADTPIIPGIFEQALESARTAQAAALALGGSSKISYALCRPPGHHAAYESMGGYCYFNNAVIAVATLRDMGIKRVGLLDIDYHFGNGSFELLKAKEDVIFISLHACTQTSYPYTKVTEPLHQHSLINFSNPPAEREYLEALTKAIRKINDFGCEAIVVSLGYDIIKDDPHGGWDLPTTIYKQIGKILRETNLPLCFVQEGGYLINELGNCAYFLFNALTE